MAGPLAPDSGNGAAKEHEVDFIVPDLDLEDIERGPIDSGHHVGCMAEGCGDFAAVMWVDLSIPWISVLCARHGRESLPSVWIIANPVFFDSCPADLRGLALARAAILWEHHNTT
jgi:hypothetical protein